MQSSQTMPSTVSNAWWIILIEGILTVILGIYLLTSPALTALLLIQVVGLFWLVGGVFDIIGSLAQRDETWGYRLISGIVSVIGGIVVLLYPAMSTFVSLSLLYYLCVFGAIVSGIFNIAAGFGAGGINRSWGRIIWGIVQIILGIFLVMHPLSGTLAFVFLMGIFAILGGIAAVIFAFRLRTA